MDTNEISKIMKKRAEAEAERVVSQLRELMSTVRHDLLRSIDDQESYVTNSEDLTYAIVFALLGDRLKPLMSRLDQIVHEEGASFGGVMTATTERFAERIHARLCREHVAKVDAFADQLEELRGELQDHDHG